MHMSYEMMPRSLEAVTQAYEHALFARFPQRFYHVGNDANLAAIFKWLPMCVQDIIFARLYRYPN